MSSTEEAAARAANEELNQSVRFADLEQKYVDLQKDRQVWFDKAKAGDDRLETFESEKETMQATILELRSTLSAAKTELSLEKDKTGAANSESKSQQERSSRLEAEADNLREEIRYVQ
jgi:chromosome segregation ATPase